MKHSKLGSEMIDGLQSYIANQAGKVALKKTKRDLPGPAPTFKARDIQRLRKDVFQLSQPLFAQLLNVEVPTVRAWEQGTRQPSGTALRLLEILARDPSVVRKLKAA
jgi:DNA-binding transcriptional regulator YiaG